MHLAAVCGRQGTREPISRRLCMARPLLLAPRIPLGGAAALTRRFHWRFAEGGTRHLGTGDNTNLTPEGALAPSVHFPFCSGGGVQCQVGTRTRARRISQHFEMLTQPFGIAAVHMGEALIVCAASQAAHFGRILAE